MSLSCHGERNRWQIITKAGSYGLARVQFISRYLFGSGRGRAAGIGGMCRSHGNVGIVSEKLQTFRSKERAWREFVGKDWRWYGQRLHFVGKKRVSVGKEKCIIWVSWIWLRTKTVWNPHVCLGTSFCTTLKPEFRISHSSPAPRPPAQLGRPILNG